MGWWGFSEACVSVYDIGRLLFSFPSFLYQLGPVRVVSGPGLESRFFHLKLSDGPEFCGKSMTGDASGDVVVRI